MSQQFTFLRDDVLLVKGDMIKKESFKDEVIKTLEGRSAHIILDMDDVIEINSVHIGRMISLYKRIITGDKKVCLVSVADHLEEMLEMCRLDSFLIMFDTKEKALEELGSG